jgi:AP-4 complex subunit mu-1
MYWIVRDYVGHVSEDSVRRNFLLIYELLDEVLDYGFPQNSSTERLKQFIAMEPVVVRPRGRPAAPAAGPSEVVKSVLDTARTGAKEEIFVDVVEKLTAIFDARGHLRSSSIVGAIKVKSYLGGNPPIRLGLPENLILGQRDNTRNTTTRDRYDEYSSSHNNSSSSHSSGSVILDTYSLHEGVDHTAFDRDRVLELVPPEGHFDLLTYRCSSSYRPPFRVYPVLEDDAHSPEKMTLFIRLRTEYESTKIASGVEITVPLPPSVQRVHCETDSPPGEGTSGILGNALPLAMKGMFGQQAEWDAREHRLIWSLKNLKGGKEHVLRVRLTIDSGSVEMAKHEYGPVMVQFVLPGKSSISGMDVKYLRILKEEKGYNPARWFRVVALANSYQIRTG